MPGLKRDGCWFCPNAKLCEHSAIAKVYPEAWKKYVDMESETNLAYPKWNCFTKETLHDRAKAIEKGVSFEKPKYEQLTIWDLFDTV